MRAEVVSTKNGAAHIPLVELFGVTSSARIFGRCEGHNEFGSIKSKMVRHILLQALQSGRLRKGDQVIEASSGNTGIALAGIGKELGLEVSIVLLHGTDVLVVERLESLGANIHYCERDGGMRGMLTYIKSNFPGVFTIDQFRNKDIVQAYVDTHTNELLDQLGRTKVTPDYFFACVGTGGTLQGIGTILRKRWPAVRIVAVEKEESAVPIDGIRNTTIAYFGDADIYNKHFADETVYVGGSHCIPDGLMASSSCGALLEAIRRYPIAPASTALAVFCDATLSKQTTSIQMEKKKY